MEYEHNRSSDTDFSTSILLSTNIGRCENWSNLLRDSLRVHGIESEKLRLTPDDRLAIDPLEITFHKEFQVKYGYATPPNRTFIPGLFVRVWDINDPWQPTDKEGMPAQGSKDPASAFLNHYLIRYSDMIYDPSYGAKFPGLDEWENGSLQGIGGEYNVPAANGNSARQGLWIGIPNKIDTRQTDEETIP